MYTHTYILHTIYVYLYIYAYTDHVVRCHIISYHIISYHISSVLRLDLLVCISFRNCWHCNRRLLNKSGSFRRSDCVLEFFWLNVENGWSCSNRCCQRFCLARTTNASCRTDCISTLNEQTPGTAPQGLHGQKLSPIPDIPPWCAGVRLVPPVLSWVKCCWAKSLWARPRGRFRITEPPPSGTVQHSLKAEASDCDSQHFLTWPGEWAKRLRKNRKNKMQPTHPNAVT